MSSPPREPGPRDPRGHWRDDAGPRWLRWQPELDAQLRPFGEAAIEAARPRPGDLVLDVGCGAGDTCLDLARRVAPGGRVTGVDVSAALLARARERARAAGLDATIDLVEADAGADADSSPLPGGHFDIAFARFGLMFFPDPIAGFAAVRSTLKPGGRLAFACWRERDLNPWLTAPAAACADLIDLPAPDPLAPGPCALADPERVRAILDGAGFVDADLRALDVPLLYGGGVPLDRAVGMALEIGPLHDALGTAPPALRAAVVARVRAALAPHAGTGGITLPAAAWIVTALRP